MNSDVLIIHPTTQAVYEYQSVRIQCYFAFKQWTKDGVPLSSTTGIKYTASGIFIKRAMLFHGGVYKCSDYFNSEMYGVSNLYVGGNIIVCYDRSYNKFLCPITI